jgi:RNA polymerase sigma factor (sigma-70 family)
MFRMETFNCGHPRTPENSRGNGKGKPRICKECQQARRAKLPKKKKPRPKVCGRGHVYTPETTIITASGSRNCRICWSLKLKAMRVERAPKKPKVPRTRCRIGHELKGDNAWRLKDGRVVCRACKYRYQNERNRLKRLNLPYEYKLKMFGAPVEEKIRAYRQKPDENGCRLWTGPVDQGGRPHLQGRVDGKHAVVFTLARLWEQESGRKLPENHVVDMPCPGGVRCTTYEHMRVIPWVKLVNTAENKAATALSNRMKRASDRAKYVERGSEYVPDLRKMLIHKFGQRVTPYIEDIVQEALVGAYLHWARDRKEIANLKAFLMTAARNRASDLTHRRRETQSLDDLLDNGGEIGALGSALTLLLRAADDADPAVWWELREDEAAERAYVAARLKKMSPAVRAVIRLKYEHDLSQAEIAQARGISINTVEQQLTRGHRIMLEGTGRKLKNVA